jgi:hypothetical protein
MTRSPAEEQINLGGMNGNWIMVKGRMKVLGMEIARSGNGLV